MSKNKFYFLDANALYEYIGRNKIFDGESRIEKKNYIKDLDQQKFKFLPSSVFTEIIVHFRNDLKKLKIILRFIDKKNIKITPSSSRVYKTAELSSLLSNGFTGNKAFIFKELKNKIDIEARFTYTFVYILSLFYGKNIANIDNLIEVNFLSLVDKILSEYRNIDIEELINNITLAYEKNKETQATKDGFTKLLHRNFVFIHALSTNVNNRLDMIERLTDEEIEEKFNQVLAEIGPDHSTIMDKIKGTNINGIEPEIIESLKNSYKQKKYSTMELEYIAKMYLKWMSKGQKFRKNDLFDMFFIGTYCDDILHTIKSTYDPTATYEDIYLVTFDAEIIEFMKDNNITAPPIRKN